MYHYFPNTTIFNIKCLFTHSIVSNHNLLKIASWHIVPARLRFIHSLSHTSHRVHCRINKSPKSLFALAPLSAGFPPKGYPLSFYPLYLSVISGRTFAQTLFLLFPPILQKTGRHSVGLFFLFCCAFFRGCRSAFACKNPAGLKPTGLTGVHVIAFFNRTLNPLGFGRAPRSGYPQIPPAPKRAPVANAYCCLMGMQMSICESSLSAPKNRPS